MTFYVFWCTSYVQFFVVLSSEGIAVVLSFGTLRVCNTLIGKKKRKVNKRKEIEEWYKLIVQYRHSTGDTWEKIVLLHHKRFSSFFCKRTNNIHKFEGCFLRGQVSSKGFIVSNGSIVEYLNFIGPVAKKKKKPENLLFSANVASGQSSSKCASLSVLPVKKTACSTLPFYVQGLKWSHWHNIWLPYNGFHHGVTGHFNDSHTLHVFCNDFAVSPF